MNLLAVLIAERLAKHQAVTDVEAAALAVDLVRCIQLDVPLVAERLECLSSLVETSQYIALIVSEANVTPQVVAAVVAIAGNQRL